MNKTWQIPTWTDLNSTLCNAGLVLQQLSYQANWELAIKSVHDNLIDIAATYYVKIINIMM